ncbi:MAG: ABC transporter ATP-binding protein [Candidatus Hodarchaeota archaeon]
MNILEVNDLGVKVENKVILEKINLSLKSGESYIMFGPNGSGKTSLINAIMGVPRYQVVSGKIVFEGKDITKKSIDERSKLGISMAFQHPPEITGIKLSDVLKLCLDGGSRREFNEDEKRLIEVFQLTDFLDRDINVGFSGGERKRAEVLQMIFLRPKLLLLDEPDSGVDVESLILIGREIQRHLEKTGSSALIITHKGEILEFIKSKYACVLFDGNIHCYQDPKATYEKIKRCGYRECVDCQARIIEGWGLGEGECID